MSNQQLLILLNMILSRLSDGIDILEEELPEEFKVVTGGLHVIFDPKRIDYPVLKDLYILKRDLIAGIEELEKTKEK